MARPAYRDQALVIRHYDFGEADAVVVLLTRNNGLVRAVAKGVRSRSRRFAGRLEPFVLSDVQLYRGRSLDLVTSADPLESFNQFIVDNYAKYSAGRAVLAVAEALADGEHTPEFFDLCLEAIRAIGIGWPDSVPLTARVDQFIVCAARLAGWAPVLFECAQCGKPGPHHSFSAPVGGAVCMDCRPSGASRVPEQALRVLWWLLHGQENILMRAAGVWDPVEFHGVCAAVHDIASTYIEYQVGRKIPALDLVETGIVQ